MAITKEKRASVAKAQKVTDAIVKKLIKEKDKKEKVDLVNLTESLFDRKSKASEEEAA